MFDYCQNHLSGLHSWTTLSFVQALIRHPSQVRHCARQEKTHSRCLSKGMQQPGFVQWLIRRINRRKGCREGYLVRDRRNQAQQLTSRISQRLQYCGFHLTGSQRILHFPIENNNFYQISTYYMPNVSFVTSVSHNNPAKRILPSLFYTWENSRRLREVKEIV